jgi:hypothetical protein
VLRILEIVKQKIKHLFDQSLDDNACLATQDIILEVPFQEKDQAKSLGARWNPKIKKWFIPKGTNTTEFQKWFLNPKPDRLITARPSIIAKPSIYLIQSKDRCYRCREIADVFCLAADGLIDHDGEIDMFFHFHNLTFVPSKIKTILQEKAPNYYIDYTKQSDSLYFVNHCKCRAKLGDFYLHCEPDGTFAPMSKEKAENAIIYNLTKSGSNDWQDN